jgi:phenylacetyl-CoA:acceptor oxidoreductase subunit 1
MTRWAMVADLERCVGCQTCTAACRHANATSSAVQWRKVLDLEAGTYPNVSRVFVPVGCQHCDDPPCMHVCPSTATRRRADGIVTIDYDICIGCAYCDVACPYQARFKVDGARFAYGATAMQNEIEREDPRRLGVAQKCTFCSDRIDFGLAHGLTPGIDERATPACVNACIADALQFGDVDDPSSNVSRLLREQRHFRMHEEIGTEPRFYYVHGRAGASPGQDASETSRTSVAGNAIRSRGVAPWHQQHWDWKAAGNFICGGLGTGLFLFAALAGIRNPAALSLGWPALALVALGLLLVWLKIGRPMRAIFVLRQPQRSWMAREAWVATGFFPIGIAGLWFESQPLMIVAALLGLSFLFSQAMILREAKGIPVWRSPALVPVILATGLAEGNGLFLAAAAAMPSLGSTTEVAAIAAVMTAAVRAWTWTRYMAGLRREGAPLLALAKLGRLRPWFFVCGLVLPTVLTAFGLVATGMLAALLFLVAGIFIAGAGAALKLILVTQAGYNQGFALAHMPARGSGPAGQAVKPGW